MQLKVPNFEHTEYPVHIPPLRDGQEQNPAQNPAKVLIAGGGPVGLAMALALAKQNIPSVIVEMDRTVCAGSRAICLSRRSLEILERLGVLQAFADKGLPWTSGRSFYHRELVLQFSMMHDGDQRLAPMTNLQQYYIEAFLLDEALRQSDLIDIRWGTRLDDLHQDTTGVDIQLLADNTPYRTRTEYVIACDGARSNVRQALGLRMNGTAYEGRYVIVDIEIDLDLPTERLAWFDPPSNPGRTMLMHKQPDNLWRLDYQLHPDEDADEMIRPERVVPVVQAHLEMMEIKQPYRLIWTSTYKASALSLDSYRHGRVLFAGDAAHLVPIFGVRGLNSGFDDVFNLGWKMAAVMSGRAGDALLDSYSEERRHAWEVNVENAMKSTAFMAPPSNGYQIMREAVLSLAARHPALSTLINPRQSSAIHYDASRLNTTMDERAFRGGPAPGSPLPECPLGINNKTRYITELLPDGFAAVIYTEMGTLPASIMNELREVAHEGRPLSLLVVTPNVEGSAPIPPDIHGQTAIDAEKRFVALFDAAPSAIYLIRPDGHVCARWRSLGPGALIGALRTALAVPDAEEVR
jgi:3-(3-hydroxy-phenyl)propionate hydroxylase